MLRAGTDYFTAQKAKHQQSIKNAQARSAAAQIQVNQANSEALAAAVKLNVTNRALTILARPVIAPAEAEILVMLVGEAE